MHTTELPIVLPETTVPTDFPIPALLPRQSESTSSRIWISPTVFSLVSLLSSTPTSLLSKQYPVKSFQTFSQVKPLLPSNPPKAPHLRLKTKVLLGLLSTMLPLTHFTQAHLLFLEHTKPAPGLGTFPWRAKWLIPSGTLRCCSNVSFSIIYFDHVS